MNDLVWYILPVGALVLGAFSFVLSKLEVRAFERRYPDAERVEPASGRHHHA